MNESSGVIELHLREINQLFDVLDPSPFRERDLDPKAEEYIMESVKELPRDRPCALVIHLDQPATPANNAQVVGEAIRVHFQRRAAFRRRDLYRLIKRGLINLAIGIVFLVVVFGAAQAAGRLLAGRSFAGLFREGLLIAGWVAMWRPLEIFLYDWWPILAEQRIYERLGCVEVRILAGSGLGS